MSQFEFFMAFYSLLLGLGVAELLGGFAKLLRAPARPKFGWLTPLTGMLLLTQIMSSFFDAFTKLQSASLDFAGVLLPTVIGMLYYVCAVMVTPDSADDWASLDDYFFKRRKWTIGAIFSANLATILIELPRVTNFVVAGETGRFFYYLFVNVPCMVTLAMLMFIRSPTINRLLLLFNVAFLLWIYSPWAFRVFG
jgi:hypothetical protein